MKKNKKKSIRKKVLINLLIFSGVLVTLITTVALYNTYHTMREQLIYNRRMSIGWLQDRMDLEVKKYINQFYEFEVNGAIKADIVNWYTTGENLDYPARLRLISTLNAAISMDNNINSIEIYNLSNDRVLLAERSGASITTTSKRLDQWKSRDQELQTNMVFLRSENEITAIHQIHRFPDKQSLALVVIRMRPYEIQDIIEDIKMTTDESIFIFNDEYDLIEANYGTNTEFETLKVSDIARSLSESESREIVYENNFWFYRSVNGGKINILLAVPNRTIVNALTGTLAGSIGVAVLAIAASIAGSILFSRVISKPIIDLSELMRTITLNDYENIKLSSRQDEIGILQDSFSIMISRNQELIAQEYQIKIEKRNAQIRALQAQINPHFMYNTLQVIGGMALVKQAPEIYKITTALSDIMRYSLNFSKDMVNLQEEIQYLRSYLEIQNERFGNRIDLRIEIDKEIMNCFIPKLILQPILENSFEHGLLEKAGEWQLRLVGRITEEQNLLLTVLDNGKGITPQRLQQIQEVLSRDAEKALGSSSHIGLQNVDSRIRLSFPGENCGITILSLPDEGTAVQIRMKVVEGD